MSTKVVRCTEPIAAGLGPMPRSCRRVRPVLPMLSESFQVLGKQLCRNDSYMRRNAHRVA